MSAPALPVQAPLVDPAWVAGRQSYLGASDAATILGLNPYQTAYGLWLEKTGQAEPSPETDITRWGHRVEQVAADIYQEETGRRLRRYGREVKGVFVPNVQRHRQHPEIACNPDRGVIGERRGVQVKSSWKPWDEIPERVLIQVQHEMGVMSWDFDDVALLTGFAGFARYEVPRNDALIDHLFTIERAWWQRHVVEGIEPERTGRYRDATIGLDTMTASAHQAEMVAELRRVRDAIKRLEAVEDNLTEAIKSSMAGALRLDGRDYGFTVSWKPWTKVSQQTDWQAVADGYRALLLELLQAGDPSARGALRDAGMDPDAPDPLAPLVSLHTQQVTKGARPFKPTWKDVEPTSGED